MGAVAALRKRREDKYQAMAAFVEAAEEDDTDKSQEESDKEEATIKQYEADIERLDNRIATLAEQEDKAAANAKALAGLASPANAQTPSTPLQTPDLGAVVQQGMAKTASLQADDVYAQRKQANDRYTPTVRITHEPTTYNPYSENSIFYDLIGEIKGEQGSIDRIQRHKQEMDKINASLPSSEKFATTVGGTAQVAGLVPPQYLTQLVADFPTSGRPFANYIPKMPMPPLGSTINIPRITTAARADMQTAELAAVATRDVDDTLLTINKRTIAGEVKVSRQAVEFGAMVDSVLYRSLMNDLDQKVDVQLLNGTGASGQVKGLLNATTKTEGTYTQATAADRSLSELWPIIMQTSGKQEAARKKGTDLMIVDPVRWGWMWGALDGDDRPLLGANTALAMNTMAVGSVARKQFGIRAELASFPVMVNANVPVNLGAATNQDPIILVCTEDMLFFETPVMTIAVDQTRASNLEISLVAYKYIAFSAEWYDNAVATVLGSGMEIADR